MSFKTKTVYNKDIRLFSKDIANFNDGFKHLQAFVEEKYQINQPFLIQYQDDEDDYVTIGSAEDLEEAYRHSKESDKVLKLFIVPEEIGIPVYSFTSELDKGDSTIENKEEVDHKQEKGENEETTTSSDSSSDFSSGEEDNGDKPCHPFRDLLECLQYNEKFREEFVDFATTFVVSVQENVNNAVGEAFNRSLSAHQSIKNLPAMAKFGELLTKFPFVVGSLLSIDPDQIEKHIKLVLRFYLDPHPHVMHALPQWMYMMAGPMFASFTGGATPYGPPPFGGHPHHHGPFFGHGPHGFGHHHGHHGHHRHHGKKFGKCGKDSKCHRDVTPNENDEFNGPFPCGPFHHPPPHCRFGRGGHGFGRGGRGFGRGGRCRLGRQNQAPSEYDGKIIRSNLTLEDDAYVLPEQVAVKTWLVKNTGKVDWPEGVKISYVGNPFNPIIDGVEFPVQSLKVGEEAEVNVVIKAPKDSGFYRSRWRLCLSNGLRFGECLKCRVTVVNDEVQPKVDEMKQNKKKSKKARKQKKLLKQRAKLEAKLSKVANKIAKVAQKATLLNKIDDEDQKLPISVDPEPLVHDISVEDVSGEKKIEEPKANEFSSIEMIDEEDMEIDANEIQDSQPDENVPALISNLGAPPLPPFKYKVELASIIDMGFEDTEEVRTLLRKYKGDVSKVIANFLQK